MNQKVVVSRVVALDLRGSPPRARVVRNMSRAAVVKRRQASVIGGNSFTASLAMGGVRPPMNVRVLNTRNVRSMSR